MAKDNIVFLKWLLIGILLAIVGGTLLHYRLIAIGVPYTARIVIGNIMGCLIATLSAIENVLRLAGLSTGD